MFRNPASRSRIASLLRRISAKYPQADEDFIVESDPSDNKIFSEWMAEKVYGDGEDLDAATDAAFYLDALYKSRLFSPSKLKLRTSIEEVFDIVTSLTTQTTLDNINRISRCRNYRSDLVYEDPRMIVLEPKTHIDSCCYGERTKSRWCVSDPNESGWFSRMDQIRRITPVRFFIIINKILPIKHKYGHVAAVFYRGGVDQFIRPGMTDQDYVNQARRQFRAEYGTELNQTDEYLIEKLRQLREIGHLMEVYDSSNKMLLPYEAREYLGDDLFFNLARRP